MTPAPVSRDSAWVRAKRALTAEVFTLDAQDSLRGRLTAMRYPSATAKAGTSSACRVGLAPAIEGAQERAWQERQETLDRILLVVAPPAT